MQFVVWIQTVIAGKSVAGHRAAAVERNGVNAPAELGLTQLEELLPASNAKLSHTSVRRQTLSVGALLDRRVTEPEEYDCLEPRKQVVRTGNRLTHRD